MKFLTKTLIAGLILTGGVALAEAERTDPNAKEREKLMESVGAAAKVLGDMAKGEAAFDAAAAEKAKADLVARAAAIPATFKTQGAVDPASEAKPEIWTGWDDFVKKAGALGAAAAGLDVASLDGVKASMAGLGAACKDCHTTYRVAK